MPLWLLIKYKTVSTFCGSSPVFPLGYEAEWLFLKSSTTPEIGHIIMKENYHSTLTTISTKFL